MAVIFVLVDDRRRLTLFGMLVAGGAVLGVGLAAGLGDTRLLAGAEEDSSAASHVAIGQVAIAIALDNPLLGIGHEHFEELAPSYMSVVSVGAGPQAQKEGQEAIGAFRPHNDFLEVWTSWGVIALAAYVAVMLGAFANCVGTARSSDPLIRGLGVGCAAGIVAYAVNSSFHNYLDSSVMLWAFAGFSVVLARLANQVTDRRTALRPGLRRVARSDRPGQPLRGWT
jgi:O-antigen ligase